MNRNAVPGLLAMLCAGVATAAQPPGGLYGFGDAAGAQQLRLEQSFDRSLSADDLRSWMQRMAAEPNHVGSPHDKANAEFQLQQFRAWGWDAAIETFFVLFPTPTERELELISPLRYRAKLSEPPIGGPSSASSLPPYNVYGADGDVTGEAVYVNYGMPEDYKDLERRGVSVKGRVAIARYGGGWRGLKPKLAYEHGAIACIIYSDPRDDGFGAADPYPVGFGRPAESVQRGSVLDMPVYPGDPLTPGVGATKDAQRLSLKEARTVLKIPVLPISQTDALPILRALGGPRAPPRARGGLPITYHLGPGPAVVHLKIVSEWSQKPIFDVIARIRGSESPNEWVIRGNHHDGWVFGAEDPLSGQVAMMAEMKAIGRLLSTGWHPKRTIVYASWDGEEPGLLGSTEWVEAHIEELRQKAVAYVNSDDESHRGFLQASGSHSLQRLVNEVAAGIVDPDTGASVLARARAREAVAATLEGASDAVKRTAALLRTGSDLPLGALGSGSDFTPFLQHAGISSLNLGYADDEPSGAYHSAYDTYDRYARIVDPGFTYGIVLAKTGGHVVLRLADAELLPFRFSDFADAINRYVGELERLADTMRDNTVETRRLLDEKAYDLASSRNDPVGPPAREPEVPFINFAPLKKAAHDLTQSARTCDAAIARALADPVRLSASTRAAINDLLRASEQLLTNPRGLPGRGWYKHLIYAPGLYTGYDAKTLPGIREAIEQRRFAEAAEYIDVTADALNAYRGQLERITALTPGAHRP